MIEETVHREMGMIRIGRWGMKRQGEELSVENGAWITGGLEA